MSFIEKLDFTGDNPQPRFGHTVTFIDKHRAILFGGAVGDTGRYVITGDIFLCETLNKKFRKLDPKGTSPSNRAAHATVFLDDILYIYGGALGAIGGELADDNLYQLNIKAGEDRAVWTARTNQPITPGRRYGHVMAYMKPFLVVFGGNTGSQPVNDVWVLQIESNSTTNANWTSVNTGPEIPCPRVYHSAAVCRTKTGSANGMLVVFGGRTTDQSALSDTWGLRKHKDGRLDWVKAPIKHGCQPPSPRYQHSLLFLGTLMLVVGGRNNQVGESLPFDIYNTQTSEWFKLQSIQKFRHAAWIMQNFLYVHGGFDQDSPNVPTEKLLRVDLAKAFLPYPSLLQQLSWETGKDLNSVPPQMQHHHPPRTSNQSRQQLTASYPQSAQSFQRQREDVRKHQTNSKPIRLCNEAVVVSFDEQVLRKVTLDKLQQENRRLTDPIVVPQTKAYLQKIYNQILNTTFLKPPTNLKFNVDLIYSLIQEVDKIISEEQTVLKLRVPIKIIGDIHGQLNDLNKLFEAFGAPTDQTPLGDIESTDYLFLGDYVDRGTRSLQTILMLFALKLKFPQNVHLLRGAHQDIQINRYMGFGDECATKLGQNIDSANSCFQMINKVFSKLPLAAVVERNVLCLHGGIGTTMKSISDLDSIPRPIQISHQPKSLSQKIVHEVLWSDPSIQPGDSLNSIHDYFKNKQGIRFGQNRIAKFCAQNNIAVIIRSHQPVPNGVNQTGNVITVFSCTDYCGGNNDAGVVSIKRNEEIAPKIMLNVAGSRKEVRWLRLEQANKSHSTVETALRSQMATPPKK